MSENAKNKLQELVRDLGGCIHSCINFQHSSISSPRSSSVMVTFPDGRIVRGTGAGQSKPDADIAAAQDALDRVEQEYPDLLVDWIKLAVDAQAGDALIKLSIYLSAESKSAAENSIRLKDSEPNAHLAKVFDRWKADKDPRLAIWGTDLSKHRKATLVEALLWHGYGQQVIATNAPAQLANLLSTLLVPES
jgi:Double-stranded RNA binding motif